MEMLGRFLELALGGRESLRKFLAIELLGLDHVPRFRGRGSHFWLRGWDGGGGGQCLFVLCFLPLSPTLLHGPGLSV